VTARFSGVYGSRIHQRVLPGDHEPHERLRRYIALEIDGGRKVDVVHPERAIDECPPLAWKAGAPVRGRRAGPLVAVLASKAEAGVRKRRQ